MIDTTSSSPKRKAKSETKLQENTQPLYVLISRPQNYTHCNIAQPPFKTLTRHFLQRSEEKQPPLRF